MASVSPFRSVALAARLRQGQALPTLIAELKAAASTSSLTSLATAGQSSSGLKLTNPLQALALACAQDMAAIESGRLTLKDLRLNDVKIPDHVSVGEYCVAAKASTNSPFAISPQSAAITASGDHRHGGASNQQHQQQHDQDEVDAEHAALLSLLDTFLWREAFATDRTLSSAADLVPYLPTFSTWDPTGTPALKGSVLDAPFKCKSPPNSPSEDCSPKSSMSASRRSSIGGEVESIDSLRSVLLEAQSRGLLTADTTANDDGLTRVFLCDESVLPRVLALARASNSSGQQQVDATRGAHLSSPPSSFDSNTDTTGQSFGEFGKGDAAPQPLHVVVPFSTVLSATLGASMWHDKDMARDRLAVGSQLRQLLLLCARSHKKTIAAHKHSTRGSAHSHNNSDHQGTSSQSPESEEGETPEPSRWMQRKIAQEREKDEFRYGRLFSPESVLEESLLHQCTVSFMPFSAEVRLMQEHLGRTAAKAAALEQQSATINTQIRRLQDQQKVEDKESGNSSNNAKAAAVSPKHIATARTAARYAEIAAAGTAGELSLVWGLPAASSPPPVDTIIKNAASLFGCGSTSDHDADTARRDAARDASSQNAASRLADAALGEDDDSFDLTSTSAEHSGDGEVPAFESPEEAVAAMRRWHEAVLPWILPGLRSHNAVLAAAANGTLSSSSSSSSATSASSHAQGEDVVEMRKVSVGIASASMALHGWCLKRGVPCDRLQGAGQANASNRPVAEAAGRFASRMAQRDRNKEQRAFGPPAS